MTLVKPVNRFTFIYGGKLYDSECKYHLIVV